MRPLIKSVVILALIVAAGYGLYRAVDPERREIDAAVRAAAPGQFVHLTDGYTHYEIGGPAGDRVVVLAAGVSVPYYIWDPTFTALVQAGFRVVRYDYYGRGYSDRPDIPYTQALYVRQLAGLLDSLQIKQPIDLAGLSYGGSVVTSFAAAYPTRVRSLIYVDPSFWSPYPISILDGMPAVWNYLTAVLDERWWPDSQLEDFLHPERFPDWPDRYKVQLQYRGFRRAQHSTAVANASIDQGPELRQVGEHPRPVIAFWGKDDHSVPIEFSATLLQAMPHARLVAVEEAGHLPHLERPDVVHPALIAFLRASK
jgi:pimeloyl-ACP methyl ester carboxylesterase